MADTSPRDLFRDAAFVEEFETRTRHLVEEIFENANPHPSGTDAHTRLRELITRIAREELARAGTSGSGTPATYTGLRGDLDRAGMPRDTEPVADLAPGGDGGTIGEG